MPQKKVTKLYTDEEIEKFQLIAREEPEKIGIFLHLVGIIPTKSVMHKAKYRAGILSVSKMNELRRVAPFLFGEDKNELRKVATFLFGEDNSPSESIINAYFYQLFALASKEGKTISCENNGHETAYYIDNEKVTL